jgi:hypothetical protein
MISLHGANLKRLLHAMFKTSFKNLIASGFLFFIVPSSFAGDRNDFPLLMRISYANDVDMRLDLPIEEVRSYADLASGILHNAGLHQLQREYLALVDRNPNVQAIILYWIDSEGTLQPIGASPVSTGKPGNFDYFETPIGIFQHTIENLDFRAEGTKNVNGIRGYGVQGMRVFDFGWQKANKGWGDKALSDMRLQMHATDPDFLEPKLGTLQSKGCIRIPATLNRFIDQYGLLDADYENAIAHGKPFWVLLPDRRPTRWPGRYLIVLDTLRQYRPNWAIVKNKK